MSINRKSNICDFPATNYINFFHFVRYHCIIVCLIIFIRGRDKIFKSKSCVGLRLTRYRIEAIGPWVSIFDILTIGHFSKRIIALARSRTKSYFLACSLRILINPYAFLCFYDWLWWHGGIILAIMAFAFWFILHPFAVPKLYLWLIAIWFNFVVAILVFIKTTKRFKACLIIILVIMGILELIDITNVGKKFSISKAFDF